MIDFPSVGNDIYYSTLSKENIFYPDSKANTYRLIDLANMAHVNLSAIKDIGGVFEILMNWNCDVDDLNCRPNFEIKYINQTNNQNPLRIPLGYFAEKSINYEDKRDYILHVGLKFKLISSGIVKSFNIYNLLIQVK